MAGYRALWAVGLGMRTGEPCERAMDMADSGWDRGSAQVRELRKRGYTDDQIRQAALVRGWTGEQVDRLLAGAGRVASGSRPPGVVPEPRPAASPIAAGARSTAGRPSRLGIGEALAGSLQVLSRAFGPLLVVGLIWWGVGALPLLLFGKWAQGQNALFRRFSADVLWILWVVCTLVGIAIFSALAVGTCGLCLEALRGRRPAVDYGKLAPRVLPTMEVGAAIGCAAWGLPFAVIWASAGLMDGVHWKPSSILLAVVVCAGVLVAVYSLLIGPLLGLALPAVADGMSAGRALAFSVKQGAANWGPLAGLSFVLLVVNCIVGAPGSVGLIISTPWTLLVLCAVYEQVVGEADHTH